MSPEGRMSPEDRDPTRVGDPALSRPEVATPGYGQPGEMDAFGPDDAESPTALRDPAARRASRWALLWMALVLLGLLAIVLAIILK